MQRKNSLLKSSSKAMRRGMAMIMAISVIVIIATILALSLALTSQTTKKTTDLYLYEQAAILSHSAAEYVMLKLSETNPCSLNSINFTYNNIYDINATMRYITVVGTPCDTNATAAGALYAHTTNTASDGTVVLDVTVSVPTDKNVTSEPVKYFRRTLQKL
jgi:type II secretory pathway pseudopilin PulG